jgi:hypothetical protein
MGSSTRPRVGERFFELWKDADAGLPLLAAAKRNTPRRRTDAPVAAHDDVIVVGVGGMGSGRAPRGGAWRARVSGSSSSTSRTTSDPHGLSRIIRLAHWEHPDYVPLVRRAATCGSSWRLPRGSGCSSSPVRSMPAARRARTSPARGGLPALLVTTSLTGRVDRAVSGYRLPADAVAIHQPEGGFLLPNGASSRTSSSHGAVAPRCAIGSACSAGTSWTAACACGRRAGL